MIASPMPWARRVPDRVLRAILAAWWLLCEWWPLPVGAIIIATLMGCAGPQTAPGVVKVPVSVPCQTQVPPRPVFPSDTLTGDEDLWTLGITLWADRKARKAWELDIETRLKGCVDGGQP
jgi:hypothetical protein